MQHQRILFFLKLEKELILNDIAEAEEEILNNSLIANTEPTSEAIKESTKELNTKIQCRIDTLKGKLAATEAKEKAFLKKLHGITEPELKEMAKAYYIDGQSCEEIGQKYYLERTTVYKRLKRYFDD